eukprot:CAMPEP_0172516834 /NCGR_PEP_ID=MMETSP1066-20121228/279514_1 /TAXON_ID=671091 /ORGANISM="Coscinodiscus wailesii, Strain CCMP2513" /LENGTH=393 /DNA_ID=CAMNT_0013298495 /DNA_START=150 /DNA_END=1331 /DNA_ORIENTATION=+
MTRQLTSHSRAYRMRHCSNNHINNLRKTFSPHFFSTSSSSTNIAFDRDMKRRQRNGAARSHRLAAVIDDGNETQQSHDLSSSSSSSSSPSSSSSSIVDYDYFYDEIAARLVDRLDDIRREGGFPLALEIGAGAGHVYRAICAEDGLEGVGGMGGIRKLVQLDSSEEMLYRDKDRKVKGAERCGAFQMVLDEEETLPFPDGTFDIVVSSLAFHRVNDLPNVMREIKRVLKQDGCIIFAMVGGSTLPELRSSLVLAEMERDGGVSPHVGPFVDLPDVGVLLTNAGFTLPTIDIDTVHISYPDAMVLMEHLQRMGEGNACVGRRKRVGRDTFVAAAAIYEHMFGLDEAGDDEGGVTASVQVIYGIAWTPHDSQPKPNERGSADHKIGDMVKHSKNS